MHIQPPNIPKIKSFFKIISLPLVYGSISGALISLAFCLAFSRLASLQQQHHSYKATAYLTISTDNKNSDLALVENPEISEKAIP
jgi:hypothetical protein